MQHIQEIILDVGLTGKNQRVKAKQWDNQTRIVKAMILNNGVAAEFDPDVKARYSYCKPDNTQVLGDAERNNNLVTIQLDPQCLTVSGICYCDITFYQGEAEISTATFEVEVYPGVYSPDRLESSDEYLSLSKVLGEAQTAVEEMEELNAEVTSGEQERIDAEAERQTNESNRSSAEAERQTNEKNRSDAEDIRIQNETNRVNAENSRVSEYKTIIDEAKAATDRANNAADSVKDTDLGDVMNKFNDYVPIKRTINSKELSTNIELEVGDINGAVPNTITINGKPLTKDVTLLASDISDAVPTSTKVNGHSLSSDIVLDPDDIGAIPKNLAEPWTTYKIQTAQKGWELSYRKIGYKLVQFQVAKTYDTAQSEHSIAMGDENILDHIPLSISEPVYFPVWMTVAGGVAGLGVGMINQKQELFLSAPAFGSQVRYVGFGITSVTEDLGEE